MSEIEYFTPPMLEEILMQNKKILEMNEKLLEILSHPPLIYRSGDAED